MSTASQDRTKNMVQIYNRRLALGLTGAAETETNDASGKSMLGRWFGGRPGVTQADTKKPSTTGNLAPQMEDSATRSIFSPLRYFYGKQIQPTEATKVTQATEKLWDTPTYILTPEALKLLNYNSETGREQFNATPQSTAAQSWYNPLRYVPGWLGGTTVQEEKSMTDTRNTANPRRVRKSTRDMLDEILRRLSKVQTTLTQVSIPRSMFPSFAGPSLLHEPFDRRAAHRPLSTFAEAFAEAFGEAFAEASAFPALSFHSQPGMWGKRDGMSGSGSMRAPDETGFVVGEVSDDEEQTAHRPPRVATTAPSRVPTAFSNIRSQLLQKPPQKLLLTT